MTEAIIGARKFLVYVPMTPGIMPRLSVEPTCCEHLTPDSLLIPLAIVSSHATIWLCDQCILAPENKSIVVMAFASYVRDRVQMEKIIREADPEHYNAS